MPWLCALVEIKSSRLIQAAHRALEGVLAEWVCPPSQPCVKWQNGKVCRTVKAADCKSVTHVVNAGSSNLSLSKRLLLETGRKKYAKGVDRVGKGYAERWR